MAFLTRKVFGTFEKRAPGGRFSKDSRELFGPEKLVVKLQSACFQKLIFLHAFNMRKIKRIAKFEGLEPRRCEDIKGIVVPDIGPKSFGTFEKQAPGACFSKVPKLFVRISGDIILFVSSKQRRLEARNFAVIFVFIPFTTYEKTSFTE